jgi:hypothetical protein
MSNTLITNDVIADRAIAVAHEKATFLGTVFRDYDEEFGKKGSKVGDTIRIRKPNQYTRRQGSRVMVVQDQQEANTSLVVSTQDGVDMSFNSAERALSIDKFSERYIEPAVAALVSGIESDVLQALTKTVANVVGSAGAVPGASADLSAFFNAQARLNQMLAPKDKNRRIQLDSVTMASVANGAKALFHDSDQVEEAFREGFYSRGAGFDWYTNERVLSLTNGSDVSGTTDAASAVTDGGSTLSADTASPVTYVVGQTFTIAGVYACHPETKQSLGYLMPFTNTAGTGSGGDFTISPPTYLGLSATTAAKQNVCKADSTKLALTDFNSQTLVTIGSASTAYKYGLAYHRDAFAFVTADLPLKGDAVSCVRKQFDGLALRVWQGSDIVNDLDLLRIDILYGYKELRPEWACRIVCN